MALHNRVDTITTSHRPEKFMIGSDLAVELSDNEQIVCSGWQSRFTRRDNEAIVAGLESGDVITLPAVVSFGDDSLPAREIQLRAFKGSAIKLITISGKIWLGLLSQMLLTCVRDI
jgi:hypothetical protein